MSTKPALQRTLNHYKEKKEKKTETEADPRVNRKKLNEGMTVEIQSQTKSANRNLNDGNQYTSFINNFKYQQAELPNQKTQAS